MNSGTEDIGILEVFVEHLEMQSIPRALSIKARIDLGEPLNEMDILFFEDEFEEISSLMERVSRHPEMEGLVAKLTSLYHEITERALQNQRTSHDKSGFL